MALQLDDVNVKLLWPLPRATGELIEQRRPDC
jgi:hypothetical protein